MFLFLEKWTPTAIGVICAVVFAYLKPTLPSEQSTQNLLMSVVNISAIGVGFLATAKAILFSLQDDKTIKMIQTAGYYHTLVLYLVRATYLGLMLAGFSCVCLVIDWQGSPQTDWRRFMIYFWIWLLGTSAAGCFRVIRVYQKLLELRQPKLIPEAEETELVALPTTQNPPLTAGPKKTA